MPDGCQSEVSRGARSALWAYKEGSPLTDVCDADVKARGGMTRSAQRWGKCAHAALPGGAAAAPSMPCNPFFTALPDTRLSAPPLPCPQARCPSLPRLGSGHFRVGAVGQCLSMQVRAGAGGWGVGGWGRGGPTAAETAAVGMALLHAQHLHVPSRIVLRSRCASLTVLRCRRAAPSRCPPAARSWCWRRRRVTRAPCLTPA